MENNLHRLQVKYLYSILNTSKENVPQNLNTGPQHRAKCIPPSPPPKFSKINHELTNPNYPITSTNSPGQDPKMAATAQPSRSLTIPRLLPRAKSHQKNEKKEKRKKGPS